MEQDSGDEVALIRLNQERKMWRKNRPHVRLIRDLLQNQKNQKWVQLTCSNGNVKFQDLRIQYGKEDTTD